MGTWGTGISSNDDYADVYSEFFELYNDGKDVPEVTTLLIARNSEMLSMPEAANNVWFAIAKAQWECKKLQPAIYDKVKEIVESESDIEIWKELDASKRDLAKRRKILDKFLLLLQSERPKAKNRKKKIIRQPLFSKGDCLTFKLRDGNYGGAVILEAEYDTEFGLNLVALTRLNQTDRPVLSDFENAEVLLRNFGAWSDKPAIRWILKDRSKAKQDDTRTLFEVVDSINISQSYLDKDVRYEYAFASGWQESVIDDIWRQFQSEVTKPRPTKKLMIRELIRRPRRWRFW